MLLFSSLHVSSSHLFSPSPLRTYHVIARIWCKTTIMMVPRTTLVATSAAVPIPNSLRKLMRVVALDDADDEALPTNEALLNDET